MIVKKWNSSTQNPVIVNCTIDGSHHNPIMIIIGNPPKELVLVLRIQRIKKEIESFFLFFIYKIQVSRQASFSLTWDPHLLRLLHPFRDL